jgi:alpha-N-arabinofuranosidase
MKGRLFALSGALMLAALAPAAGIAQEPVAPAATATVHGDQQGPTYDRRIFTQFAEHLGEGIYGGLYVGNDRKIPNTRGFRNDVIGALKGLGVPTNITGVRASDRGTSARSRSTPTGAA